MQKRKKTKKNKQRRKGHRIKTTQRKKLTRFLARERVVRAEDHREVTVEGEQTGA
jgi:hypothetical protein